MLRNIDKLTARNKIGIPDITIEHDESYPCGKSELKDRRFCPNDIYSCDHWWCSYMRVITRLAEYEETKLTPADIHKLKSKVKRLEKRIKELKELQRESQIDNLAAVEGNADNTEV